MLIFGSCVTAHYYRGIRQARMDREFLAVTIGTGRLIIEPSQRLLKVRRSLRVGRTLMRLLGHSNKVVNRPRIVATAAIMIGEVHQVLVDRINEQHLDRLSGTFM